MFADWFDPAYKAGGPVRSCKNFVDFMRGDYKIFVYTSNRDLNDKFPMVNIECDKWVEYKDNVSIFYASENLQKYSVIKEVIKSVSPDFIYINSMFSYRFAVQPVLSTVLTDRKFRIILAPRGMLKPSALKFKKIKKTFFLKCFRWFGIAGKIRFQATDEYELKDIKRQFRKAEVFIAPNFPAKVPETIVPIEKKTGSLSLIFVGRIHRVKNPDFVLEILKHVKSDIKLTLVGLNEDHALYEKCLKLTSLLPPNIKVDFKGDISHKHLEEQYCQHHALILPTRGENFGHAIFESLSMGRPVVISNQTPWINLSERKAGWDLPLTDIKSFVKAVEEMSLWGQEEFDEWSREAHRIAGDFVREHDVREKYKKLFN